MKKLKNKNKLPPKMFVKTVKTEGFWDAMTKPGFVRTSWNEGWLGRTRYVADIPPEQVDRFLQGKMEETVKLLGAPPSGISTFLLRFGHWIVLGTGYAAFVTWLWN